MPHIKQRSILYVSHYYPPEVNAPALRVSRMAERWAEKGNKVTVLTGFPNHPNGVIPGHYRGRKFMKENRDGIDIVRTWVYASPNKGFLRRVLNYISFMLTSVIIGVPKLPDIDVVVATSPQFFVAIAGYAISLIKRVPFVFEVRDVWPEEIVAVGAIKNRFIVGLLEWIEMFLYRQARLIVAVAEGTVEILTKRGVDPDKIVLLPNGVDLEEFTTPLDVESLRSRHSLDGEFLVSYIGTHGMAHRLQTVVSAADKLRDRSRIRFMMVGDGAEKQGLMEMSRQLQLDNMTFVPQLPHEDAVDYYRAADACLVPLRKAELFTKNIPSKIYEIMAAGRPVVIGAAGESRRLVQDAEAGISFEPEDVDDLVNSILKLYNDRDYAAQLGKNGFEYASRNCSRSEIADRYLGHLMEVAG